MGGWGDVGGVWVGSGFGVVMGCDWDGSGWSRVMWVLLVWTMGEEGGCCVGG